MLALVHHLGYSKCVLVGHDWGAWLTWQLALLHPQVFTVIAALSVPYSGYGKSGLLTNLRSVYGNENEKDAKFFYMLHHNLPQSGACTQQGDVPSAIFGVFVVY